MTNFQTFHDEWVQAHNAANPVFTADLKRVYSEGDKVRTAVSKLKDGALNETGVTHWFMELGKFGELVGAQDDERKAKLPKISAALKKLDEEIKKYTKTLDGLITGKIEGQEVKIKIPSSYRQLKILKTEVLALQARALSEFKIQSTVKDLRKIDKNHKGEDEATKKLRRSLLTFAEGFRSTLAKGAAAAQKIKASPNVATYNQMMEKEGGGGYGRAIHIQLLNIDKLKKDPKLKDLPEVKNLLPPGELLTRVAPFGTGNNYQRSIKLEGDPGCNLPQNLRGAGLSEKDIVGNVLKEYSKLVKDISERYKALLAIK